ncbi:MAG: hypothetical protein KGS72_23310 [Cyanobacteria bacterium REEB67]|nr:hypothetical protein [Cyanobacteria bacterium REEB67]
MSDSKETLATATPTGNPTQRPVMNKRATRKEDGRSLIYYSFGDRPADEARSENDLAAADEKKV